MKIEEFAAIEQAIRSSAKGDKEPSFALLFQSQWYQSRYMATPQRDKERYFCFQETCTVHRSDSLQKGHRVKF